MTSADRAGTATFTLSLTACRPVGGVADRGPFNAVIGSAIRCLWYRSAQRRRAADGGSTCWRDGKHRAAVLLM